MAIRMRRGNEADFDPSKMLPGEWAVSTDTKYVRMCFSPGIVLRMATYEAFESDMAEIRKILSQCQNIQTAVELIQKNVTNSELVIENYVKEAKQYRDEAEQFRNEAFSTTPEGYEDLVKNVSDNTVKIDTIIEKAELNIKNNAKGSNIHLTDSADSNVVALELYGKIEQNTYTGKNFLDFSGLGETTINGVTFTPVYDGNGSLKYINANGTASADIQYNKIISGIPIADKNTYLFNGANGGSVDTYTMTIFDANLQSVTVSNGETVYWKFDTEIVRFRITILSGVTMNNVKFYPMISLEGGEYEPYVGGMPSPNPSYPQEIKSVVLNTIKTHGKNLLDLEAVTKNSTFDASGLINTSGVSSITDFILVSGKENVTISNARNDTYTRIACYYDVNKSFISSEEYSSKKHTFTVPSNAYYMRIAVGVNIENIQLEIGVEATEYQPYQSSEITLSEPIELNGFNGVYDVVTSECVTRRFAKVVYDGSDDENWIKHAGRANTYYINHSDKLKYGISLCSHYRYAIPDKFVNLDYCYYNGGDIMIKNKDCNTLEDWKAELQSSPVTVVYELATPTTEELQTDFTALKTFYPETYVSNDADCDMSITYTADAKNYIDNKIALLTTAIYNNI